MQKQDLKKILGFVTACLVVMSSVQPVSWSAEKVMRDAVGTMQSVIPISEAIINEGSEDKVDTESSLQKQDYPLKPATKDEGNLSEAEIEQGVSLLKEINFLFTKANSIAAPELQAQIVEISGSFASEIRGEHSDSFDVVVNRYYSSVSTTSSEMTSVITSDLDSEPEYLMQTAEEAEDAATGEDIPATPSFLDILANFVDQIRESIDRYVEEVQSDLRESSLHKKHLGEDYQKSLGILNTKSSSAWQPQTVASGTEDAQVIERVNIDMLYGTIDEFLNLPKRRLSPWHQFLFYLSRINAEDQKRLMRRVEKIRAMNEKAAAKDSLVIRVFNREMKKSEFRNGVPAFAFFGQSFIVELVDKSVKS